MSHMCKRIFRFELQLSSYWQNIKFSRNCPKFHVFTKNVIFKHNCTFIDQLLHPYKFYGRDMSGILFFIFASCEQLIHREKKSPMCKVVASFATLIRSLKAPWGWLLVFMDTHSVRCHGIICPYLSASARSFYITLAENEVLPVFVDFN